MKYVFGVKIAFIPDLKINNNLTKKAETMMTKKTEKADLEKYRGLSLKRNIRKSL